MLIAAVGVAAGSSSGIWVEETLSRESSGQDVGPRAVGFFLPLLAKLSRPYPQNF